MKNRMNAALLVALSLISLSGCGDSGENFDIFADKTQWADRPYNNFFISYGAKSERPPQLKYEATKRFVTETLIEMFRTEEGGLLPEISLTNKGDYSFATKEYDSGFKFDKKFNLKLETGIQTFTDSFTSGWILPDGNIPPDTHWDLTFNISIDKWVQTAKTFSDPVCGDKKIMMMQLELHYELELRSSRGDIIRETNAFTYQSHDLVCRSVAPFFDSPYK